MALSDSQLLHGGAVACMKIYQLKMPCIRWELDQDLLKTDVLQRLATRVPGQQTPGTLMKGMHTQHWDHYLLLASSDISTGTSGATIDAMKWRSMNFTGR